MLKLVLSFVETMINISGVITNISEDLYEDEYFVVMIIRHKNSSANCHFYNVQAKYFQVVNPDSITLTPEETEVLDIVFNTFMDTHLQKNWNN